MFIYVFLAADFFRNYSRGKAVRVVHEKEQRKLAQNPTNARVFEGRNQIIRMSSVDNKGPRDNEAQSTNEPGRITPKIQLMTLGLALTTVFLFVRAFYRVAQVRTLQTAFEDDTELLSTSAVGRLWLVYQSQRDPLQCVSSYFVDCRIAVPRAQSHCFLLRCPGCHHDPPRDVHNQFPPSRFLTVNTSVQPLTVCSIP